MLFSTYNIIFNEVNESLSVRSVLELKVYTLTTILLSYIDALLLSIMLQYHLLKEKECSFVINFLSNLDLWLPEMRRVCLFTIITLQILNNEFHYKSLLEKGTVQNLFLNSNFNFKSIIKN